MDHHTLVARAPVWTLKSLNWLLLALCAVAVIVTSFFLFYWNRLIGWLIAFVIRFFFWRKLNVWVECEAFQVSFLAGRILIKDLRYHSRNQSIRVLKCHVTWRYWLWRAKTVENLKDDSMAGESVQGSTRTLDLPCRIHAVLDGVECFFYNRTPAFDEIVRQMRAQEPGAQDHTSASASAPNEPLPANDVTLSSEQRERERRQSADTAPFINSSIRYPPTTVIPSLGPLSKKIKSILNHIHSQIPTFDFKDILPISFAARGCSIVLGNDSTPSVLIAAFDNASGTYAVTKCRSKYDQYKNIYNLNLQSVKIITRTNPDHQVSMLERGRAVLSALATASPKDVEVPFEFLSLEGFQRLVRYLPGILRKATPKPPPKWQGLSRYMTEEQRREAGELDHEVEYAKVTTLVETPILEVVYHADEPGPVPENPRSMDGGTGEKVDVGNGDLSPEWGIELIMHGGSINYGPWADRQRDSIQKIFFPATYMDDQPTPRVKPGDLRIHSALKILFEVKESVTFRLPTREESKDWKFKATGGRKKEKRPFGWLDVRIAPSSSLVYTMSMVANDDGYHNGLEVHLSEPTISSSVNGTDFWTSESCRVICDMPSPLAWNAERTWTFETTFNTPLIYLLRDHTTLITDLIRDWTSGPPTPFHTFVPTIYVLKFWLKQFKVNLYVSDHNVIDHPLADDTNALMAFVGPSLEAHVTVPSNKFRPHWSTIPFWIEASGGEANFSFPTWNTHRSFAREHPISIGRVGLLRLDCSYQSFAEVGPNNVDKLKLDLHARQALFKCFGWAIRHFLVLKDNYFGSFTNFNTSQEYLAKRARGVVGDPVEEKYRPGSSNPLEVSLNVNAQDSVVLLPREIHGCESAIALSIPELQLYLRLHDYLMEMTLNLSPTTMSVLDNCKSLSKAGVLPKVIGGRVVLDGLSITSNRLFGPLPHTAAYLCIWEIQLGSIRGVMAPAFAQCLMAAVRSMGINYTDALNAPAVDFCIPLDPDVTVFKFGLQSVDVTLGAPKSAFHLTLPEGISVNYHDLAGKTYQSLVSVEAPILQLKSLVESPFRKGNWFEVASLKLDMHMDFYSAPTGWRQHAAKQTRFLQTQDGPTRRAQWAYTTEPSDDTPRHLDTFFLPHPQLRNGRRPPQHHRLSKDDRSIMEAGTSSESEGDVLSEGERHARLASSRPSTSRVSGSHLHTKQNFSSGDESDNGSSTSFQPDSDTDLSEPDMDVPEMPAWPRIEHYHRVLKRYTQTYSSGLSNSPAFTFLTGPDWLEHEYPGTRNPPSPNQTLPELPSLSTPLPTEEATSVSLCRIRCRNPIDAFMSPLVVLTVQTMLKSFDELRDSMDHHLDGVLADFLAAPDHDPAPSQTTKFIAEVAIPGLRISLLQKMEAISQSPTSPTLSQTQKNEDRTRGQLLSITRLHVDHVALLMAQSNPSKSTDPSTTQIAVNVGSAIVSLHTTSPMAKGQQQSRATLMTLSVRPSTISLNVGKLVTGKVILGEVDGVFSDSCPDAMAGTLSSGSRTLSEIFSAASHSATTSKRSRQSFIQAILTQHQDKVTTTDPLPWTHASFMVKLGLPRALRTDPSWRILVYIRQRVGQMSVAEANSIEARMRMDWRQNSRDATAALIASHRSPDELDEHKREPLLLEILYPLPKSASSELPLGAILFQSGKFSMTVSSKAGQDNNLLFGPLSTRIQAERRTFSPNRTSENDTPSMVHLVIKATIHQVGLSIFPTFIPFIRLILQVHRGQASPIVNQPGTMLEPTPRQLESPLALEFFLDVHHASLAASALNVIFDVHVPGILLSSSAHLTPGKPALLVDAVSTLLVEEIIIRARGTHGDLDSTREPDVLAAIVLAQSKLHAALRDDGHQRNVRLVAGSQGLRATVPKSAMRLFRFIEESRKEYLSTYETMVQDLLDEIEKAPPVQPPSKQAQPLTFDVQVYFQKLAVVLQVMHGTWLSWELHSAMAFGNGSMIPTLKYTFGVQLSSQIIDATVKGIGQDTKPQHPTPSIRLPLPPIKVTGDYPADGVQISVVLGFFSISLKPQYVDDILAIQQKFGSDFNDLVDIWARSRQSKVQEPGAQSTTAISAFKVGLRLDGFRLALEGPSSTQYLDAGIVEGRLVNSPPTKMNWSFSFSNLSLSLAHHSILQSNRPGFDRKYRSAYMVLDFFANNESPADQLAPGDLDAQYLNVNINKIHAVMQAAAIGQLGDLIDHVQAEMLLRKDQRATELAEIKNKTQRVIDSLELEKPLQPKGPSWMDNRNVSLRVESVGIAIPLTVEADLMPSQVITSQPVLFAPTSVRAFLFSIQTIEFFAKKYETGNAKILDFSFKFVPQFDQSVATHFEGRNHETRNRMSFPAMSADVDSKTDGGTRQFLARASVSGFELDLDPSIANFVFSLVDVYRQGKERIEKLAPGQARANFESLSARVASTQAVEAHHSQATATNFQGDFEFRSGKVRFFPPEGIMYHRGSRSSAVDGSSSDPMALAADGSGSDLGVEVFDLPILTVTAKFQATSASEKFAASSDSPPSSTLAIHTILHSSHNVLRPSILPFFGEVVRNIEARLQQPPGKTASSTPQLPLSPIDSIRNHQDGANVAASTLGSALQLSITLTIDRSNLELTCLPDVNVNAGVQWESGGFILTVQPGAKEIALSGQVQGITTYLRHGYLHEDSLTAEARNLTFTANLNKGDDGSASLHNVSVLVNTEVAAKVRFARLQDVLCFKAVWLDRIPLFENRPRPISVGPSEPLQSSNPDIAVGAQPNQRLAVFVLVKIHQVDCEVDLGQSITKLNLKINPMVIRSVQSPETSEVSLDLTKIELVAVRTLSGHLTLPRLEIKTQGSRRPVRTRAGHIGQLEITITTESLDMALDYDRIHLIRLHADPLRAMVLDDWTKHLPQSGDRGIRLDFSVHGGEIRAIGVGGALSILIGTSNKVRAIIRAQKEGAARESKAFRTTLQPKPNNPLSDVATAMLQSARSKFKESETFEFAIIQHMQFSVAKITLQLYGHPSSKLSHFEALGIEAELERHVRAGDQAPRRDLHLSLGSFDVGSFNDGPVNRTDLDVKISRESAAAGYIRIFTLPKMEISMQSVLQLDAGRLDYEFKSDFPEYVRTAAGQEIVQGVYVVLNFAEYEELISVQKRLEAELVTTLARSGRSELTMASSSAASTQAPKNIPSVTNVPDKPMPVGDTPAAPPHPAEEKVLSRPSSVGSSKSTATQVGGVVAKKMTYRAISSKIATPKLSQTNSKLELETFTKMTGINVKEALPIWVHEYATIPIESIMKILLDIYARRLKKGKYGTIGAGSEDESDDDSSGESVSGDSRRSKEGESLQKDMPEVQKGGASSDQVQADQPQVQKRNQENVSGGSALL